jgi:hypothetical protein
MLWLLLFNGLSRSPDFGGNEQRSKPQAFPESRLPLAFVRTPLLCHGIACQSLCTKSSLDEGLFIPGCNVIKTENIS